MSIEAVPQQPESELQKHAKDVARKLPKGLVTPLLGAGVNAYGRPDAYTWAGDSAHLPVGKELARYLAKEFETPSMLEEDLARVSQFIEVVEKSGGELYQTLHEIFDGNYQPGPVHNFLARLAVVLQKGQERDRDRGLQPEPRMQVILTTNYDDALERAFDAIEEPYDLLTYVAANPREYRGRFVHWPPPPGRGEERKSIPIVSPNDYPNLDLSQRTVIVKLHGAVRRARPYVEDNYVITEDHYIEYLTRTDSLPAAVNEKLKNSHLLFLGYGLADWNLRALLRRIWSEQSLEYGSWAIQKPPRPDDPDAARTVWELEQAFWKGREVTILGYDLDVYVSALAEALEARLAAA